MIIKYSDRILTILDAFKEDDAFKCAYKYDDIVTEIGCILSKQGSSENADKTNARTDICFLEYY